MLPELNALESTYGEERVRDVVRAIRYLQRHQFLFAGDRGTATVYNTVTDHRFERFVRNYFDAAGYRLVGNEAEQWIGILPDIDDPNLPLPRMRVDETIAVLVLALYWQEAANAGDVEERATVVSTVNTLYERYEHVVARGRKTAIGTARFVEILKECRRRNIVDLGPFEFEQQDQEVVIRSQIKLLAGDEIITRIEGFARDEEAFAKAADPASDPLSPENPDWRGHVDADSADDVDGESHSEAGPESASEAEDQTEREGPRS